MSKLKKILIIFITVVLTLGVIFIVGYVGGSAKLLYIPEKLASVNYNNYLSNNDIDYKDRRFAWLENGIFHSRLAIADDQGNFKYFSGVRSPFQICGDQVIFVKGERLLSKDTESGKDVEIANRVERFAVYHNSVLYLSQSDFDDDSGVWRNGLYLYHSTDKAKQLLYENVAQFYIHRDTLFVVNDDDCLIEISLDDYSAREIVRLEPQQYPFTVMPQGDNLLICQCPNQLDILELATNKVQSIAVSESEYANNKLCFICDDDSIYYSFQATETNGSIVTDADDKHNGVWRVDPQTLEKEQILSETFESLYLFEGDRLFGVDHGEVYRIDLGAKRAIKIAG